LELATQLNQMLELEFKALREQNLDEFEGLQPVKGELLLEIAKLAPPATDLQAKVEWQDFREMMMACRELHRRNEILIERRLDAIRGTLQSLRIQDNPSQIEVYNRLGHIARFSGARGYDEA
jgi:flagellar biosynthesis/type III secretory pathway chaperone